jgi:hypothetical protein
VAHLLTPVAPRGPYLRLERPRISRFSLHVEVLFLEQSASVAGLVNVDEHRSVGFLVVFLTQPGDFSYVDVVFFA